MSLTKKLILLISITLLTYLPSFWNQFVWDDEQFIYKNQYVINFNVVKIFTQNTVAGAGQKSDYFRPLTTLSFALDHQVWGLSPFGFHLTNTLLHIAAGLLLYLLLTQLGFSQRNSKIVADLSFWVTLFFLIQPIQTEAVTYINSRGDSLFTLFGLLSVYLFSLSFEKKVRIGKYDIARYLLLTSSLITYFASILSKEIGIIMPGLWGLILLFQLIKAVKNYKNIIPTLLEYKLQVITLISSLILAGFYMFLRSTIWNFVDSFNLYHQQNQYTSSLLIRLLTFTKIIFIYLRLLLFPYPLHMERDTALAQNLTSVWPWLLIILISSILGLGYYEFLKKKTSWIWFGLIWFFICLVPVSGIIPINGLLYEHWLYLPMIGFYIVIFRTITIIFGEIARKINQPLTLYPLLLITSLYILLTLRQNWIWRNPISFYEYQLQYSVSARMLNNLAMAYSDQKNPQKAIEYYQKAIAFSDAYPQTHHNLANAYLDLFELEKAKQEFLLAIKMNPDFDLAYGPLVNIYLTQKDYAKASETLNILVGKYPDNLEFQLVKAQLLIKLGQKPSASKLLEQILIKSNNHPQVKTLVDKILNSEIATPAAKINK